MKEEVIWLKNCCSGDPKNSLKKYLPLKEKLSAKYVLLVKV